MAKIAVLFTGQGAQSVGMGKDIADAYPAAADLFEQANQIVGYDLRGLCFEGPAEKLEQTDYQQPAIFTTSMAIWRALNGSDRANPEVLGGMPSAMAGLSLGEYSALCAAGAIEFADALRLVQCRGQLMQQAASAVPSGMVSAMGLEREQIEQICEQASAEGVIAPANFNCPGQIVVSGAKAACEKAAELMEQAGGRAIPLKVAGAFHSPLMQPAADGLAKVLADTQISQPTVPVLANVNCQYHGSAGTIRPALTDQLTHPVLWQASMEKLIAEGVERFIEIGPGRVLTGLMRKISRQAAVENISTAAGLKSFGVIAD